MPKTKTKTKAKTKSFTVHIEMTVTVYSCISVEAATEADAEAKAEELAKDYVLADFSGNTQEALDLSGNGSFDVGDIDLTTEEDD